MQVLLVDDSLELQTRLVKIIKECEGVSAVFQAYHVTVAKKILMKKSIDVVVSDVRMPGSNGFDLVRFVKENFKNIVFIFITNYNYKEYRQRAKELGADYFLSKSDELENLPKLLEELAYAKQG